MIKSVCLCVSQCVCHTNNFKPVERSTGRNTPPIFTKLDTKVESQDVGYILFLVDVWNIYLRQTRSGIERYDVELSRSQIGNQPWGFDCHYELGPI